MHVETRREALSTLRFLNHRAPRVLNAVIREGLLAYTSRKEVAHSSNSAEEVSRPSRVVERLPGVVLAITSFGTTTDILLREELLAELIILAHHPDVGMYVLELPFGRKLSIS